MENFFYYSLCKQFSFEIDLGQKGLAFELIIELFTVSTQKSPILPLIPNENREFRFGLPCNLQE